MNLTIKNNNGEKVVDISFCVDCIDDKSEDDDIIIGRWVKSKDRLPNKLIAVKYSTDCLITLECVKGYPCLCSTLCALRFDDNYMPAYWESCNGTRYSLDNVIAWCAPKCYKGE